MQMKIRGIVLLMLLSIHAILTACNPSLTVIPVNTTTPPMPTVTSTPLLSTVMPTLEESVALEPIDTLISEVDGMELVYVPASNFLMGLSDDELEYGLNLCGPVCNQIQSLQSAYPQHEVYLDAYWIDRTEVTNVMFATFLNSTRERREDEPAWLATNYSHIEYSDGTWQPLNGYEDHPVEGVSWYGAQAYCEWAERRLPTEAEWEKAARGDDGRLFPWGDRFDQNAANLYDKDICDTSSCDGYKYTSPVGSFPLGASPYGALDMAGNVEEWVWDRYNEKYYAVSPAQNPHGPSSSFSDIRVLRGGSSASSLLYSMTATRMMLSPSFTGRGLGFRCALSAYPAEVSFSLSSIHMFSETQGWGLLEGTVWITWDGGLTWRDVSPQKQNVDEQRYVAYGYFFDADRAWLIFATLGGESSFSGIAPDALVYSTSDGGQTWNTSPPLNYQLDITVPSNAEFSATDTQTGLLRVKGWGVSAGPKIYSQFFRTTDGGATWKSIKPSWCNATGSCHDYVPMFLSIMYFLPGGTGWYLEDDSICDPCDYNIPNYHISTDGGVTWESHVIPAPQDYPDLLNQYKDCEPYQLNLISEDVVRLKLACGPDYGDDETAPIDFLYASENGGLTWTTHELPPSLATMVGYFKWSQSQMLFFDADHGLLLGREMYRTADAGATWQLINTVPWDGQFSFIDRLQGWAITEGDGSERNLMHTTDGGETWHMLNPVEVE